LVALQVGHRNNGVSDISFMAYHASTIAQVDP
jgi:hypothetical protein